jgi:hypothetical protein
MRSIKIIWLIGALTQLLSTHASAQSDYGLQFGPGNVCYGKSDMEMAKTIANLRNMPNRDAQRELAYIYRYCPPKQSPEQTFQNYQYQQQQQLQARQKQQLANNEKYISIVAVYQANGDLFAYSEGQLFQSKDDCGRFVEARSTDLSSNGGYTLFGESVVMSANDTGSIWNGCIKLKYDTSQAFEDYMKAPMTLDRARQMKRFPEFEPQQPQNNRGAHVRI